jgi:hypothetical protein
MPINIHYSRISGFNEEIALSVRQFYPKNEYEVVVNATLADRTGIEREVVIGFSVDEYYTLMELKRFLKNERPPLIGKKMYRTSWWLTGSQKVKSLLESKESAPSQTRSNSELVDRLVNMDDIGRREKIETLLYSRKAKERTIRYR